MDSSNSTSVNPAKAGIKTWPHDDRPREKLMLKGVQALSNAEILAILLRSGDRQKTALALAQELLNSVGQDLFALSRLGVKDCMKFKGIGQVKAITLVAALELGRRRQSGDILKKPVIHNSKDAAGILQPLYADYRHEIFAVLFLNIANQVTHYEIVSQGGLNATVADPKIILRKALEEDSTQLMLCHNHPSGNLKPSREDIRLTKKICAAAHLFDIKILDHLIVSIQGYFSFADDGLL